MSGGIIGVTICNCYKNLNMMIFLEFYFMNYLGERVNLYEEEVICSVVCKFLRLELF